MCPLLVWACPGPWANSAFVASAPGQNVCICLQESGGEYVIIVLFFLHVFPSGHQMSHFVVLKCAEHVFYRLGGPVGQIASTTRDARLEEQPNIAKPSSCIPSPHFAVMLYFHQTSKCAK